MVWEFLMKAYVLNIFQILRNLCELLFCLFTISGRNLKHLRFCTQYNFEITLNRASRLSPLILGGREEKLLEN